MLDEILAKIETLREFEENYQQVHGVKYLVQGLDYHYSNFLTVVSNKDGSEWFHELIAYLNRLGQIYYFFKSKFMAVDDEDIPIIKQIISFRMKYSAHRSVDIPKSWDGDNLVMMDVTIPNMHPIKPRQEFPEGYKLKPGDYSRGICIPRMDEHGNRVDPVLFIEDEHEGVMVEINSVLSRKLSSLGI